MNTHIVYSQNGNKRVYFSGSYSGDINTEGYVDIEWEWTFDKDEAKAFCTTDAWDLLHLSRYTWPQAIIEVERIVKWP